MYAPLFGVIPPRFGDIGVGENAAPELGDISPCLKGDAPRCAAPGRQTGEYAMLGVAGTSKERFLPGVDAASPRKGVPYAEPGRSS